VSSFPSLALSLQHSVTCAFSSSLSHNRLIICEGCGVRVHQQCYDVCVASLVVCTVLRTLHAPYWLLERRSYVTWMMLRPCVDASRRHGDGLATTQINPSDSIEQHWITQHATLTQQHTETHRNTEPHITCKTLNTVNTQSFFCLMCASFPASALLGMHV